MKLFTLGPVEMYDRTFEIAKKQVPYFRTPEFSEVVLECEGLLKKFANAGEGAKTVFLTCSGTGAMEATVLNCFDRNDKLLIIDGGSFFPSVLFSYEGDPTPTSTSVNNLGSNASHGCVRLAVEDAKWIYENCLPGMTVVIK